MSKMVSTGTDGSLFDPRRLQAHTQTRKQVIREVLFANDAALVANQSQPCNT